MVQGLAGIRSCCLPKIERDKGGGRNTASCFCQRCQPPQHPQAGPASSPSPADSTPRLAVSVPFSLTPSGPGDSGMGSVVSFSPSVGMCCISTSSQFANSHARQRSTSSSSPSSALQAPARVQNGRSNHAGQNPPNSQSRMAVILSVAGRPARCAGPGRCGRRRSHRPRGRAAAASSCGSASRRS